MTFGNAYKKESICLLCVDKGVLSDRCESCQDFSQFVPAVEFDQKPKVIGMEDIRELSGNGKLSLLLWLVQRREQGECHEG